jgi:hypothetical protein
MVTPGNELERKANTVYYSSHGCNQLRPVGQPSAATRCKGYNTLLQGL